MFELKITASTPEQLDEQLLALARRLGGLESLVKQDIAALQPQTSPTPPMQSGSVPVTPLVHNQEAMTPPETVAADTAKVKSKHTKKETVELAKELCAQGQEQDKAVQAIMGKMNIGSLSALTMDQVDEFHERLSAAKAHFHVQATNATNAEVTPPTQPDSSFFSGFIETQPEPPQTQVTKAMLMSLVTKLVTQGMQAQANEAVTSMGFTNMSQVPPERYAGVYAKLQALDV